MPTSSETTPHDSTSQLRRSPASTTVDPAATQLRRLLLINAEFSLLTGGAALVAGGPVADFLAVDQVWLIRLLGAGLIGFATLVFITARARPSRLRGWSRLISANDLGWVAGTIAVLALGWLSTGGAVAMGLIGLVVLALGVGQLRAAGSLTSPD